MANQQRLIVHATAIQGDQIPVFGAASVERRPGIDPTSATAFISIHVAYDNGETLTHLTSENFSIRDATDHNLPSAYTASLTEIGDGFYQAIVGLWGLKEDPNDARRITFSIEVYSENQVRTARGQTFAKVN